ncbi:unnamed protein product, partial [Polarella glacialis]
MAEQVQSEVEDKPLRQKGYPVQVPSLEDAWLSRGTVAELLDPANLNSGQLQDIYQQREDDFEEPTPLEVWYTQNGVPNREILFVDGLYAEERPRVCVSLRAVHAMHRAIAVLTRKLDNTHAVLRTCRTHYYKELMHLREMVRRKEGNGGEPVEHETYFFVNGTYQDELTLQMWQERLDEAKGDMQQQLSAKTAEAQKLHTALTRAREGFEDEGDVTTTLRLKVAELVIICQTEREALQEELEASNARTDHAYQLSASCEKEMHELSMKCKTDLEMEHDLVAEARKALVHLQRQMRAERSQDAKSYQELSGTVECLQKGLQERDKTIFQLERQRVEGDEKAVLLRKQTADSEAKAAKLEEKIVDLEQ